MNVQWYPGHMAKTRRMIGENLNLVDAVAEIVDARIPISSRNPDIDGLVGAKPRLIILNRADQADPAGNQAWSAYFKAKGFAVLETDANSGKGVGQFAPAVRALLKEQIAAWTAKGQVGRQVRAMVVGVPNVGKSTFINKVARRKSAAAQNRPGVTRGKQWVNVDKGLELLDTPGILWPKFEDQTVGLHLAMIGSINDEILNRDELACQLIDFLTKEYPGALGKRYGCSEEMASPELLGEIAKSRGCLLKGNELDYGKASMLLIDDFRSGRLGKISLEFPPVNR